MGSIGPSYTNADWAGSRYIYNSAGNLRIKSVGNLQFYSGGTSHTTNLALDFATNRIGNFSVTPTVAGSSVWHAGNDGTGSGLDADLLDGQQGSYYYSSANPPPTYSKYLRADVSDVYNGRVLGFGTAGNGTNTSGAFLTIDPIKN